MNAQRTVQIIRPSSELSTEDQKIKAAAYCRVSTDSDDQENSFLAQVKYYSDYIGSREDMILVDIYADEGITGTAMSKREEFKRLLSDAKLGRIDRVFQTAICKCLSSMMDCKEDVIALIHSNLQYALTGNNSILDTVAIEKQIDNYYDQMGTLVERSASTSGDTDLYDREIKKLCDKIEVLRETLKTEQSKSVMTEDVKASIDRILGYLSKTDERSFLTYDDVTIRRLVECIVVHPEGKISVTLKGGFRGEETI